MLRICFIVFFCQVFCKPLNQGLITFKPHLQNSTDKVIEGENYVNGDYRWGKETFFERNAKWKLATTTEPPIQDYYSNWVKDPKPDYDKNYYNLVVNNRPTLLQVDGKKEGRETELDKQHYHNNYDYDVYNSKKYFDRDHLQYPSHRQPDTSNYFVNDKNYYYKRRYDNKVGSNNPYYNYISKDSSGRGKDKANQLLNYFKNQLVNQYSKGYYDGQEDFYQKRNQCLKLIYNSEY